ncbi:uncharacterized protein C14orf93 homolog isoform X2 [Ptychodera flava]|uniref:uncharacterized protein C14orf93 homolog isoform X2 n=1 Tax=Ptychodera flava TaxID=63121 RepID=UPI00396A8ABF
MARFHRRTEPEVLAEVLQYDPFDSSSSASPSPNRRSTISTTTRNNSSSTVVNHQTSTPASTDNPNGGMRSVLNAVNRMHDKFVSTSDQTKDELLKKLENLEAEVKSLRENRQVYRDGSQDTRRPRLDPIIFRHVKRLYSSLEDSFDTANELKSVRNQTVFKMMVEQLKAKYSEEYTGEQIDFAVFRKWQTERRKYLYSLEKNKERVAQYTMANKLRSRRRRSRGKMVQEDEKRLWGKVLEAGDQLMSDEEDGPDGLIIRSPGFRSQILNDLIVKLDNRMAENLPTLKLKRIGGPPCGRDPPKKCHKDLLNEARL